MPLALLSLFSGKLVQTVLKGVSAIPKPVWEALTVLGYVLALYALHQHYARQHDAALIAANNAQWQAKLNAEVAKMSAVNAQNAQMANQLRKANDEVHSRIDADAGDLSLRGPGRATCPRVPNAAPAPRGPEQAAPVPDVAGPALPPADGQDLSAVPWNWLVQRAQEHDDLLADDQAMRELYSNLVKNWPHGK